MNRDCEEFSYYLVNKPQASSLNEILEDSKEGEELSPSHLCNGSSPPQSLTNGTCQDVPTNNSLHHEQASVFSEL